MKYYCLIFRWFKRSFIFVRTDAEEFGAKVAELLQLFDAPSTIGTWSTWAESPEEATEKAAAFFEKDGWTL